MKQSKAPFEEVGNLVKFLNDLEESGQNVPRWRRVVHGYQVLVDNCADPALDYLEFKPELLQAKARIALLESALKTVYYLDDCPKHVEAFIAPLIGVEVDSE